MFLQGLKDFRIEYSNREVLTQGILPLIVIDYQILLNTGIELMEWFSSSLDGVPISYKRTTVPGVHLRETKNCFSPNKSK